MRMLRLPSIIKNVFRNEPLLLRYIISALRFCGLFVGAQTVLASRLLTVDFDSLLRSRFRFCSDDE